MFSRATSGIRFLHHTGFWELLKSPHFYESGWAIPQERKDRETWIMRDSPGNFRQLLIPILCLYMRHEDKKNLPYRGVGEWTSWRLGWHFAGKKGSCQEGYSLSQHELCGSEGVLHPDLLLPLFLKTVFTWARSTSACLIPSPAILPHLWKKSAMPQLNHSIKKWNFEQWLPSLHWGTCSLETGHTTSLDTQKWNTSSQSHSQYSGSTEETSTEGKGLKRLKVFTMLVSWETSTPKQCTYF